MSILRTVPRILRLSALCGAALVPLAAPAFACDHEEARDATVALEGARSIEIRARAGKLAVRPGDGDRVEAEGRVCASSRSLAGDARLTAERRGDRVVVEVDLPKSDGWFSRGSVSLDLEVAVPPTVPVSIVDSSGDLRVHGVTVVSIEDSSGSIDGHDLAGDLRLRDSSGDVNLRAVAGSVTVTDSSGTLRLRDIDDDVHVEVDSSGDIEIVDVGGSVQIDVDSSGDIRVESVGGDFVVGRDGSGSIRHREIGGLVDVPAD